MQKYQLPHEPAGRGSRAALYTCRRGQNARRRWKGKKRQETLKRNQQKEKGKNYGPRFPRPPARKKKGFPTRQNPTFTRNWTPFNPVHPRPATAGPKPGQLDSARSAESFNIHISPPEQQVWSAHAGKGEPEKGSGGSAVIPWENLRRLQARRDRKELGGTHTSSSYFFFSRGQG